MVILDTFTTGAGVGRRGVGLAAGPKDQPEREFLSICLANNTDNKSLTYMQSVFTGFHYRTSCGYGKVIK